MQNKRIAREGVQGRDCRCGSRDVTRERHVTDEVYPRETRVVEQFGAVAVDEGAEGETILPTATTKLH